MIERRTPWLGKTQEILPVTTATGIWHNNNNNNNNNNTVDSGLGSQL